MDTEDTVLYEKDENGIAIVTLNRPQYLNAFSIGMRDDLYDILTAIRDDSEVKVAVFKGAGEKAFCAGADLSEFLQAPPPIEAREVRWQRDLWGLFLELKQPLLAALNGYVIGSGVEIAACCDIRIASEDAVFSLPEVGLGIIPAAGGTQTVPRLIKHGNALEMLLTGDRMDADQAYRFGFLNRVVPKTELMNSVTEIAKTIVQFDTEAVRLAKRAVCGGLDLTLAQGLALERRIVAKYQAQLNR